MSPFRERYLLLDRLSRGAADPGAAPEDWIDLFNGRDLAGWTVKIAGHEVGDNYARTFRVEDGILQVRYDGYDDFGGQFGHLYYDRSLSFYRLAFDYRFVGEFHAGAPDYARLNSGVMFHSQDPRTMPVGQDWPISVEFQLLAGLQDGQPRPTGNMCSPGTTVMYEGVRDERHCIESTADTYPAGRWVHAELVVLGDSLVTHLIEGRQVLEYTHPVIGGGVVSGYDPSQKVDGRPLSEGFVALQSEGQEVDFRNVRLLDLKGCTDPASERYRSWFVASDPEACR
ncbi:MAG: DUF1080 domain-containing protein [Gemmatimonadota bacterium]